MAMAVSMVVVSVFKYELRFVFVFKRWNWYFNLIQSYLCYDNAVFVLKLSKEMQ
jgi:hypothetical protein